MALTEEANDSGQQMQAEFDERKAISDTMVGLADMGIGRMQLPDSVELLAGDEIRGGAESFSEALVGLVYPTGEDPNFQNFDLDHLGHRVAISDQTQLAAFAASIAADPLTEDEIAMFDDDFVRDGQLVLKKEHLSGTTLFDDIESVVENRNQAHRWNNHLDQSEIRFNELSTYPNEDPSDPEVSNSRADEFTD